MFTDSNWCSAVSPFYSSKPTGRPQYPPLVQQLDHRGLKLGSGFLLIVVNCCIGPSWCWVVIKAVGCSRMSTQVQSLRLMLDFNYYSAMQAGRIVRSIAYSAANMLVCADANITGTFPNFFEVNYKLLQRILQNCNAGGLLSGLAFSVVFCPYTG